MPGDEAEDVDRDAGVGHPGKSGVPQAVPDEVLVTEFVDDGVPVGGVAEDGGGDTAAAGAAEEPGVRIAAA